MSKFVVNLLVAGAALLAMLLTGCSDSDAPTATPSVEPLFVVSGHVRDPNGSLAGSDARVVGIWTADAGEGDYSYVFGSGEIDLEAGTFRIEFVEEPPSEALLGDLLGVGLLAVVDDSNLQEGILSDDAFDEVLGAAPRHSIVFKREDAEAIEALHEAVPWLKEFGYGYSVGKGIEIPDDFDGFEPVDSGSVEIIIDDLENLNLVNWT
ncbi:MAG: hypothetical protein F4Z30_04420 [Gemmatimonadetes bacterium]|nr:hypothetical protein [Gemmatimonadota bacterium]